MKRETTKKMKLKSVNFVSVIIIMNLSVPPADLQCGTGVRALIFQLHQTGSGGNDGA